MSLASQAGDSGGSSSGGTSLGGGGGGGMPADLPAGRHGVCGGC